MDRRGPGCPARLRSHAGERALDPDRGYVRDLVLRAWDHAAATGGWTSHQGTVPQRSGERLEPLGPSGSALGHNRDARGRDVVLDLAVAPGTERGQRAQRCLDVDARR